MKAQTNTILKTLKVRVKNKHSAVLRQWAFECNQAWNEANAITAEYSYIAVPEVGYLRNHFTAFDLQKSLKGLKGERGFSLHSQTVQEVIAVHAKARKQFKKDKLRWRVSGGSRVHLAGYPLNPVQPFGKMDKSAITVISSRYGIATDYLNTPFGRVHSPKTQEVDGTLM